MKQKILAAAMLVVLLVGTLTGTAFASADASASTSYVPSPEHSNTEVAKKPTAPQTGYEFGIEAVALAAVLCGGIAIVSGKRAHDRG